MVCALPRIQVSAPPSTTAKHHQDGSEGRNGVRMGECVHLLCHVTTRMDQVHTYPHQYQRCIFPYTSDRLQLSVYLRYPRATVAAQTSCTSHTFRGVVRVRATLTDESSDIQSSSFDIQSSFFNGKPSLQ